jgi:exopolyphosphatase/pppGpp-phosphohydrolase
LRAATTSTTSALQQQPPPEQQELDASAAAATLTALQEYRAVLSDHNMLGVAAVTTAAVRHAQNAQQFAAAAAEIVGCPLQVLSGEGCCSSID